MLFCGRQDEKTIQQKKNTPAAGLQIIVLMAANIFFKPLQRHKLYRLRIRVIQKCS